MRKRLSLAGAAAVLTLLAVGGVAIAAGGFGGPGTFNFHDLSANAQLSDSSGTFLFLNVDRGVQTFKAKGLGGRPFMTSPETVLSYDLQNPDGSSSFGCFVIPDQSFVVA